jgi:hypothetical protein
MHNFRIHSQEEQAKGPDASRQKKLKQPSTECAEMDEMLKAKKKTNNDFPNSPRHQVASLVKRFVFRKRVRQVVCHA